MWSMPHGCPSGHHDACDGGAAGGSGDSWAGPQGRPVGLLSPWRFTPETLRYLGYLVCTMIEPPPLSYTVCLPDQ